MSNREISVEKKTISCNPIISVKNVYKYYKVKGNQVTALDNVSIDINKGDIYGIIGMSGAGKSTLVRCMNFLEIPDSGTVSVENEILGNLNRKKLAKIRRTTAMIFQHFNLLMQRTVLGNVCFPMEIDGVDKKSAKEQAIKLLTMVGLEDKLYSYPVQLSGGQKQRVAIARALATNPKILLCDEATSALDPQSTISILKILKDINNKLGITIVVITHQMSVVKEICNSVAIMENGRIMEYGQVSDIFIHPKTEIGRNIIFDGTNIPKLDSSRKVRIVFNSRSTNEPVVANMILEFGMPVNVLFADSQLIDGVTTGQMLIELPEDQSIAQKMLAFLKSKNLIIEEYQDE
jgi:D-methionine transport system ATP-binding protein